MQALKCYPISTLNVISFNQEYYLIAENLIWLMQPKDNIKLTDREGNPMPEYVKVYVQTLKTTDYYACLASDFEKVILGKGGKK